MKITTIEILRFSALLLVLSDVFTFFYMENENNNIDDFFKVLLYFFRFMCSNIFIIILLIIIDEKGKNKVVLSLTYTLSIFIFEMIHLVVLFEGSSYLTYNRILYFNITHKLFIFTVLSCLIWLLIDISREYENHVNISCEEVKEDTKIDIKGSSIQNL
jgi:hypothetical protein